MIKFNKGFTLIELSIVMVIIGMLTVGILEGARLMMRRDKILTTRDRITIVDRAIQAYLLKYSKLPCPASLTASVKDANFGISVDSCQNSSSGVFVRGDNFVIGAIPVVTLGLPINMIKDEWSDKFTYIVHKEFVTDFTRAELPNLLSERLVVKDESHTITTSAVYVIISHGENKGGAYTFSGDTQYPVSSLTTEEKNNANISSFDGNIYYKVSNNKFDDLVRFNTKENLILELSWRDVGCNTKEINTKRIETISCGSGFENFSSVDYLTYLDTIETPATTTNTNADGITTRKYCVAKCFDFGRIGFYNVTRVISTP